MTEQWKQIIYQGEPLKYEVSNRGRVRHIETKQLKKIITAKSGYNIITGIRIPSRKKQTTLRVTPLVADAFLGTRNPGEQIEHVSQDKTDDSLTNLVIMSQSQNIKRSYLLNKGRKTGNVHNYLSQETYDCIIRIWGTGEYSQIQIGRMFGLRNDCISKIVNGIHKVRDINPKYLVTIEPDFSKATKTKQSRKLTKDKVLNIFYSNKSQSELARKYKVNVSTIWAIKNGKSWREFLIGKGCIPKGTA